MDQRELGVHVLHVATGLARVDRAERIVEQVKIPIVGQQVARVVIVQSSVGHIARGCLLSKGQLEALFDMCTGPYDFILITNEPDGRARIRLNGVTPAI